MARTHRELLYEAHNIGVQLAKATGQARDALIAELNGVLDERLDQKNAHPAECRCHECADHVRDTLIAGMTRRSRQGEMLHPEDVMRPGW